MTLKIMNQKPRFRKGLIGILLILIITGLTYLVVGESVRYFNKQVQRTVSESFILTRAQLETRGIDSSLLKITEKYGKLLGDSGNIIITDDKNQILLNLNSAYLVDAGMFHMLANPQATAHFNGDTGYIVDQSNRLKYSVQFGSNSSLGKLRSNSLANPLAKAVYKTVEAESELIPDRIFIHPNGTYDRLPFDPTLAADYAYIASRHMNLYVLYDTGHLNNRYYNLTETAYGFQKGLVLLLFVEVLFLWLGIPLWVYSDAVPRNMLATRWAILVLILFIPGLLIYLLFRNTPSHQCSSCGEFVEKHWQFCPHCGVRQTPLEPQDNRG